MSRMQTKNGQPAVYNASGVAFADGDAGALNVNSTGSLLATLSNVATSPAGYIGVTSSQVILYDQVDGTTLNSNIWSTSTSTMTITQASNFINLNAGASTTNGAYAQLTSTKSIPLISGASAFPAMNAKINTLPEANAVVELGIFAATTTSTPTDGAFYRWASDGTFRCVVNYGGVETVSGPLTPPTINVMHSYAVIVSFGYVLFTIDYSGPSSLVSPIAIIPTPNGQPFPVSTTRLPVAARIYNTGGTPATAPQISIGSIVTIQLEINTNKQWSDTLSGIGRSQYNGPTLFTQTANHTNSTDPVSATLSNTAAGYTTLGGRFQFVAPATATTDFALFAYQVPAGFQFYCTSITISSMNLGAAVATTPTVLDWSLGVGASAVSLATTDSATTWAPRRVPLGMQSFAVADPIGKPATDIVRLFPTSQVIDAGRYFHVIVEVPVGTATASQVIRGDVTVNGYFE